MDSDDPIAWTAIAQDHEVYASDGAMVGSVDEVLGLEDESIFHGLAVKSGHGDQSLEVPAADVAQITGSRITLTIDTAAFHSLPPYVDEPAFKLGIRGLLRRPGWVKDKGE